MVEQFEGLVLVLQAIAWLYMVVPALIVLGLGWWFIERKKSDRL